MLVTLPKYVIKEHVAPFFFALIVINSMFILNILFRDLSKFLSKGISLNIIIEFLFLNLAWMIALSIPMAVLTATIMAFGRLSAENEITAIKASGISFYQILPVVLLIASFLTVGLIWFNNHILPDFNHNARLLALDIARKKPMINLNPGVIYSEIPGYNILVQKITEKDSVSHLKNVIIDQQTETNKIKTITAEYAELRINQRSGFMEFTLHNGELHEINIQKPETFKRLEFPKHVIKISIADMLLTRRNSGYRGDREKSAAELMKNVKLNRQRIDERKMKISKKVKTQIQKYLRPDPKINYSIESLVLEHKQFKRQLQTDLNMIKSYRKSVNIFLVEVHKKYSIPVACIVFILIGAPLGILTRQKGWAAAAGLSIGFFLLYWAFLIEGEILADRRFISPMTAMWSPNILVGGAGILLVIRTIREGQLSWRLPFPFFNKKNQMSLKSNENH